MVAKSRAQERASRNNGLRDLFIEELKDIYWAEKAIVKAIPKMVSKATGNELVLALEEHLTSTRTHIKRLDRVFDLIGEEVAEKKSKAIQGLIEEAENLLKDLDKERPIRDAGIIAAAQKVEHYEIASYGTLVSFATMLGESDIAELLSETLNDEKETDQLLTQIALAFSNPDAANSNEE